MSPSQTAQKSPKPPARVSRLLMGKTITAARTISATSHRMWSQRRRVGWFAGGLTGDITRTGLARRDGKKARYGKDGRNVLPARPPLSEGSCVAGSGPADADLQPGL